MFLASAFDPNLSLQQLGEELEHPLFLNCICCQTYSSYFLVFWLCKEKQRIVNLFCTCFFCLSPVRIYMVQVQKQAQEQELLPPVKWVWVKCIISHSGTSRKFIEKKGKKLRVLQAAIFQLPLDFHIFSVLPFLSHPVVVGWIYDCVLWAHWEIFLHLDSMVFAATVCS